MSQSPQSQSSPRASTDLGFSSARLVVVVAFLVVIEGVAGVIVSFLLARDVVASVNRRTRQTKDNLFAGGDGGRPSSGIMVEVDEEV